MTERSIYLNNRSGARSKHWTWGVLLKKVSLKVSQNSNTCDRARACFNHLLYVVTTRSTLFAKQNTFFSTKISKTTCCLGRCSVLNALNLEKWGVKTHNCVLLLDFLILFCLFFNWDSLHTRLNSHYEAWSYKKRSTKKITGHRKSV